MKKAYVWDFGKPDARIGNAFIFVQEARLLQREVSHVVCLNYDSKKHASVLDVLHAFLNDVFVIRLESAISSESVYEPKYPNSTTGSMQFISYLLIQKKDVTLSAPPLQEDNINLKITEKFKIAVHLKSNPFDTQSNANFDSWNVFFQCMMEKKADTAFVLIGDEDVPASILDIPCVYKFTGHVADYFAFVIYADAFMGMSSAFCGAAILGTRPYRIWKHPTHHPEIMKEELDEQDQFPFHVPGQKFIRAMDAVSSLETEFYSMRRDILKNAHE